MQITQPPKFTVQVPWAEVAGFEKMGEGRRPFTLVRALARDVGDGDIGYQMEPMREELSVSWAQLLWAFLVLGLRREGKGRGRGRKLP